MAPGIRGKITTLKEVWRIQFQEYVYPGRLKPIKNKWVYVFKGNGGVCVGKIYYTQKDGERFVYKVNVDNVKLFYSRE